MILSAMLAGVPAAAHGLVRRGMAAMRGGRKMPP
jgi:hypothetical protein